MGLGVVASRRWKGSTFFVAVVVAAAKGRERDEYFGMVVSEWWISNDSNSKVKS